MYKEIPKGLRLAGTLIDHFIHLWPTLCSLMFVWPIFKLLQGYRFQEFPLNNLFKGSTFPCHYFFSPDAYIKSSLHWFKHIIPFPFWQHTWQLNPFLFRVTYCYRKAAIMYPFHLLISRLNNPSVFPWRPMCFRSLTRLIGLSLMLSSWTGSCFSCNSWSSVKHRCLISTE